MLPNKIAFIKTGSFSHVNASVIQMLKQQFPHLEIDIIDVLELLKKHKRITLANIFFAIKEYGVNILLSKKRFLWYFLSSTYLFHQINTLISNQISKENYAFSFQTQSFFDASVEGLPHFVYTDNTILANLFYSNFEERYPWPQSRIELERIVYQNATINFTMSTNVQRSIIEQYSCDRKKVILVYAGSNLPSVNNSIMNQTNFQSKNILFVGVDWNRKGGPALVEAFKIVLQAHPDARLTIVGCSPQLNVPNCTIVGRVPLEEVYRYYEKASVFCLPTTFEPFGIVFIEALTYKLPVVATDIGGIPDFIEHGENGYLVKPNDIEKLAKALIDLLGDPRKCQTFGEKGYRIAVERYSWEKVGSMMKETIAPIINQLSVTEAR